MDTRVPYEPWLQRLLDLLRSEAWNDRLEAFEEPLDDLVHAFSSITGHGEKTDHERRSECVAAFYGKWRDEIWAGVLLSCANLTTTPGPLLIYPGVLLTDMIRDSTGEDASPSRTLLMRVKQQSPQRWAEFVSALLQLEAVQRNGWPPTHAAARVLACIREIWPIWIAVVTQSTTELGKTRDKRKDPAQMRARAWLGLLEWVMTCLAVPHGPLRLLLEYMFSLMEYYEKSALAHSPNKSAPDVLVLEVFSLLGSHVRQCDLQLSFRPTLGTRGLRSNTIRKRVQRARLKAATNWRGARTRRIRLSDPEWIRLVADLQSIAVEHAR